jgi:hypothetical protein
MRYLGIQRHLATNQVGKDIDTRRCASVMPSHLAVSLASQFIYTGSSIGDMKVNKCLIIQKFGSDIFLCIKYIVQSTP